MTHAKALAGLLILFAIFTSVPSRSVELPVSSGLAELVDGLDDAAEDARWDLAGIALDAMLEVYREELNTAGREQPTSDKARRKLARWHAATRQLISRMETARYRLSMTDRLTLFTDARKQVLILVDQETIAVSGFNPVSDRRIEQLAIRRYCQIYDCDRHPAAADFDESPRGVWEFGHRSRPAYRVEGELQCSFDDFSDRQRKAQRCEQLALEIVELERVLRTAASADHVIDPSYLSLRRETDGVRLILNAAGDRVRLASPLIARLSPLDRDSLLRGLSRQPRNGVLHVRSADHLLQAPIP